MTDEDQRPLFLLSTISYVLEVITLQPTSDRVRALSSSSNRPRAKSATVAADLLKVSCESYPNESIRAYGSSLGKKSFNQRCPLSEVHVFLGCPLSPCTATTLYRITCQLLSARECRVQQMEERTQRVLCLFLERTM